MFSNVGLHVAKYLSDDKDYRIKCVQDDYRNVTNHRLHEMFIIDPKEDTRPVPDEEMVMVMNGYDINFDGEVNILDVVVLVNIVLGNRGQL